MLQLKLIDIITISTSLPISHDYYNHVTYYSTVEISAIKMCVIIYISWFVFIWNAVPMNNGFYVKIY